MPVIRYLPDERGVDARDNETILEVSLRAGIPFAHACGGNARCSTCRVMILDGLENCAPRTKREEALTAHLQFAPEMRLACQTKISEPIRARFRRRSSRYRCRRRKRATTSGRGKIHRDSVCRYSRIHRILGKFAALRCDPRA